jgi:hypothetical protein
MYNGLSDSSSDSSRRINEESVESSDGDCGRISEEKDESEGSNTTASFNYNNSNGYARNRNNSRPDLTINTKNNTYNSSSRHNNHRTSTPNSPQNHRDLSPHKGSLSALSRRAHTITFQSVLSALPKEGSMSDV